MQKGEQLGKKKIIRGNMVSRVSMRLNSEAFSRNFK
jgi:hypothetical protein